MEQKETKKMLKNVVPNIKPKRHFEKEISIFSFIKILPEDVYHDAKEDNTVTTGQVEPKKKKFNKQILSWLFILLNIVIVAVIFINQSAEGGIRPISELFTEAPYYRFLFLGLGIMCVVLLIETLKFSCIIKTTTGKFRPWLSTKVAVIGRYWDCITPFGSGGQPFQIYFMSKNGYKADNATGIPLMKHMYWQISFCIIATIVILVPIKIANIGHAVRYLAWFGILGNVLLFGFMLFMSVNKRAGSKMMGGILKLLYKMKIIKNLEKATEKAMTTFDNYQKCIKNSLKKPLQFIFQVFLAMLNIVLNATIAYCVYLAFNYAYFLDGTLQLTSWIEIVALSILCDAAVSLIPLPGGSGAAELSFIGLFGLMFKADMQFWAMLFWRIFTYYGIILIGIVFVVAESVKNNKKAKKLMLSELNIVKEE
ncbi:MAG: flippase-like domain-containing protein [Clostridiales bacterium]|nr:flippase-like domain-containing protein [Clostridiales bacterium]